MGKMYIGYASSHISPNRVTGNLSTILGMALLCLLDRELIVRLRSVSRLPVRRSNMHIQKRGIATTIEECIDNLQDVNKL